MSGPAKAALIGALVAGGLVVAIVIAVASGLVEVPVGGGSPTRILVVAAAPDEGGSDLAALAFVADASTGQVTLLDTLETATVSGTSATTAAEALPFGGGEAVAAALTAQTGGDELEWIVLPATEWARLIDAAGGVTVDVPKSLSAYTSGKLTLLDPGSQKLSGTQAVALVSAVKYAGTPDEQKAVLREMTAAISAITGSRGSSLRELVSQSKANSSLDAEKIPDLSSVQ